MNRTNNVEHHVLVGDATERLRELPEQSIHTCVTSPPYFGLRDYGRDGQIGLEDTPDAYVQRLVEVFREVRRVLRDDGTVWLNLGDSYGATGGDTHSGFNERYSGTGGEGSKQNAMLDGVKDRKITTGVRPKNLLGMPWRVAFALQADGWYLRQDIIWHKPNPMPESVRDRCTKAHEYVFLLSKGSRYYYDADAIKEPIADPKRAGKSERVNYADTSKLGRATVDPHRVIRKPRRNRRSVWTVPTRPYKGAHFATFPPDLIEPCILAGCPSGGTVLDPFGGCGTTAGVALANGRNAVLCELNPEYAELVQDRINHIAQTNHTESTQQEINL